MNIRKSACLFLAWGFYSGKIPKAPGTFGSLAALPFCFLLSVLPTYASIAVIIIFVGIAVWIAGNAEKLLNEKDPGSIVIDEIAGMFVVFMGLPFTPGIIAGGFVLFRVLDILKPIPIRTIERRLSGGTAIVMDDVAAGVMVNLLLRLVMVFT
ncbi:MAG: phosphatidylglycerophosphatase A [Desulfobacteraceae bacterium]|nr:phosphatidylglycerophosphatase A [Desulfobacteraceae bacterium]